MTGTIRISGKVYSCEVIDGERFIEGMPAEKFLETLDEQSQVDLAFVGHRALQDERDGKNDQDNGYQTEMDARHSIRVN